MVKLKKEVTVTGDVAGYDTPRAFSSNGQHKSGYTKKMANLTGYSAVNENKKAFESVTKPRLDCVCTKTIKFTKGLNYFQKFTYGCRENHTGDAVTVSYEDGRFTVMSKEIFNKHFKYVKRMAGLTGYSAVNENRFQKLRLDQTMTPNQKIGLGVREIRRKVDEIEKFLEWYGKIKKENSLKGENFWKRTNHHIYRIKERLSNIGKNVTTLRK